MTRVFGDNPGFPEASSMPLSNPNATSLMLRAAMPEALTPAASTAIRPSSALIAERSSDLPLRLGIGVYQLIESLPSRIS